MSFQAFHCSSFPQLPPPHQAEHCCTFKSPSSQLWRPSDSREVLQNNSCRLKWHFDILVLHHFPAENILNISLLHQELITVTDCCFQEDSNRKRQACCMGKRQETNSVFTLGHMSARAVPHLGQMGLQVLPPYSHVVLSQIIRHPLPAFSFVSKSVLSDLSHSIL